jgi:hypothetical protein
MRTKAVVRDNTTMKVATVEKGVKTSVRECAASDASLGFTF